MVFVQKAADYVIKRVFEDLQTMSLRLFEFYCASSSFFFALFFAFLRR